MTISRQFYALVSVPFCLVIAFAIAVTYQVANLSSTVARLMADLQRTAVLNQELTEGNTRQSAQLRQQFEEINPAFPDNSRVLAYRLGEKYAEYLKLDIDQRERLTVETIKGLQDELSVLSQHVYELLRAGRRVEAERRLARLYQVEGQIRGEFDTLNGFQIGRLRGLVEQLDRTAQRGFLAAWSLVVALVLVMAASAFLVRRRILEPVHALLDASDRIRNGDWSARAPATRGDELGQLTNGFNFMAESLAESYASLERRVEERTQQLREMQAQLVQAEKMSAVGLLVSGVAHELNNPLASIMGAAELARMELAGGNGTGADRALDDMNFHVERCRRIVANLLQFVRKPEPLLDFVALNDAADEVLQLRDHELAARNIRIAREFDPAQPVVRGDRDKIQQVVLNLVTNGRDALLEAGRAGTITVRTRTAPGRVTLEVADDGPGFKDAARAFDPFYTTRSPGKGTGLGLSVCYGIVREHGGEITARNLERGALITVVLPLAEGAPAAETLRAASRASSAAVTGAGAIGGRGTAGREAVVDRIPSSPEAGREILALVVDDEPSLLRLQATFLKKSGIAAALAASGEEAVRYLQEHVVDLVISDVRMPGPVDGLQLHEWVCQNQPRLVPRFILVSGDVQNAKLGDAANSVARIAKPFRYEEYDRVVRQVLGTGEDR